jgi:hypothetical protein
LRKNKLIKLIINFIFKIRINIRIDGHFGQLKICSKKVFDIWMERVTFHDAPSLFWKNSLDTNRKKEFLKKLLFFIFKKAFIFYF